MDGKVNQSSGKFKMKKGFKGYKPQSIFPLVHINSQPAVKILPKSPENWGTESDQSLSDFPALPTFPIGSRENADANFRTSALFSKVLVEKPQYNFSSTKVQGVRSSGEGKAVKHTQTGKTRRETEQEHFVKREIVSSPLAVVSKQRQELQPTSQSVVTPSKKLQHPKEQKVATKKKANPSVCQDGNAVASQPEATSTSGKRKHKKKSKKTSKLQQGKVNTITQEQFVAFTESVKSKQAESSFNMSIEDENEYPALGLQLKHANQRTKKESPVCLSTVVEPVVKEEVGESEEPSSTQAAMCKLEGTSPPKPKNSPSEKKFNAPIEMNLMDMLSKMKKKSKSSPPKFQSLNVKREKIKSPSKHGNLNVLDSSAPSRKRGKEREVPKKPRMSKLKKVILKERVERRLRIALMSMEKNKEREPTCPAPVETGCTIQELETNVQTLSLKTEVEDEVKLPISPTIEQAQDIPLTLEVKEDAMEAQVFKCSKKLLHCRKFREYCNHFISEEMESLTNKILAELVRFQDRLFLKDPVKARARKRLVCGLKEVTKNLKLRKLKLVIIAPDVEEINSEGGLNDALQCILNFSENYYTPVIFTLPRRKLGKVCLKKVPLSCVGIFNYEGTEDIYKQLMELVEEAKEVYKETLEFAQKSLTYEQIQILSDQDVDHLVVDKMRTEFWELQNRF